MTHFISEYEIGSPFIKRKIQILHVIDSWGKEEEEEEEEEEDINIEKKNWQLNKI